MQNYWFSLGFLQMPATSTKNDNPKHKLNDNNLGTDE